MRYWNSIHGRLTILLFVGPGLLLLVLGTYLNLSIQRILLNKFDRGIMDKAHTLITLVQVENGYIELEFADEFMPEFSSSNGYEYFEIWVRDSLLERSDSLLDGRIEWDRRVYDTPVFANTWINGDTYARMVCISFYPQDETEDIEGQILGENQREETDPKEEEDDILSYDLKRQDPVTLVLASNREPLDESVITIRNTILISFSFLFLLTISIVRLAIGSGLRPLMEIGHQIIVNARTLSTGRVRLKKQITELEPIIGQLNQLFETVENALARERRFTSDVAHELRTPIAELKSLSEIGSRRPNDRRMAREFYADTLAISNELEQIVVNLLHLSRCDTGLQTFDRSLFRPASMLDDIWLRTTRLPVGKEPPFVNRVDPDAFVFTDPEILRLVLNNLLGNAHRHGAPGKSIQAESENLDKYLALRICNTAHNLEQTDLTQMCDRFWQKDVARTGSRNTGLGLSIVSALTQLLDIGFTLSLNEDGIFTVELLIPTGDGQ